MIPPSADDPSLSASEVAYNHSLLLVRVRLVSAVTPAMAAELIAATKAANVVVAGTVTVLPLMINTSFCVNADPVTLLAPCTVGQLSFHSSQPTMTQVLSKFL